MIADLPIFGSDAGQAPGNQGTAEIMADLFSTELRTGSDGDDTLCASETYTDTLYGGRGNDVIIADFGASDRAMGHVLQGGQGFDRLIAYGGNGTLQVSIVAGAPSVPGGPYVRGFEVLSAFGSSGMMSL